jgi:hypothetical protein
MARTFCFAVFVGLVGCTHAPGEARAEPVPAAHATPAPLASVVPVASAPQLAATPEVSAGGVTPFAPPWTPPYVADGTVASRIAPPKGFHRLPAAPGTFAAFLRALPVAPAGTPVKSYSGAEILASNDPRLAAVLNIDIGAGDLQQCADSIERMHAEWRWSIGRSDVTYPSASGTALGFNDWKKGVRWAPKGMGLERSTGAKPDDSYASYRRYLAFVFAWSNTVALERLGAGSGTESSKVRVEKSDLRGGDFFVMGGNPGHAVLIVDVVEDDQRHRRALIGQGYMPAQNFHIVRPEGSDSPWFSLDGDAVATPFWKPFPMTSARRME